MFQKDPIGLSREATWAWCTGGRKAHRDAGSRVQARHTGAWAKTGQGFTGYNVNCPLSHVIKPRWTEGAAPPKLSPIPTYRVSHRLGYPPHVQQLHVNSQAAPESGQVQIAGGWGAQTRERSHERVWSGRASWRKSSEGHSRQTVWCK